MPYPAPPPPRTAPGLIEENLLALAQLRDLVDDLSPAAYRQVFGVHGRHTVGKHVRHIIDHYEALVIGLEEGGETLDYERRRRDASLEQRPHEAGRRLAALETWLASLAGEAPPDRLALAYVQKAAREETTLSLPSSLARELAFLASHTIHHMAIIALLAEQVGIAVPPSFGVHPSTLRHWERDAEPGPGVRRRAS
ncbi:hypothetical protein BOX17_04045 [Halomonas aestuarii]|uniref:DinB-like domain-containing protein n=1 Tax=Halomonas aestuarii TaxID=1897729 RepID=A0A1J0VDZ1_9GAMM|nr:DinB family protein [Halomonas aestuarii]APE30194.1 hypothetical protein BOX17_04045 [Halomonas aestuarii]